MAKIGLLTSYDVSERNMEAVLFRIASILSDRHEVELIGPSKTSKRLSERFNIYPMAQDDGFHGVLSFLNPVFGRVGLMRRYIREEKPDIVMATSGIGSNGFTVALAGRLEKVPSVVRVTSDIFEVFKHNKNRRQKLRLFFKNNVVGRLSIALAKCVVLLHEAQSEQLVKRGGDREKFYAVPQPVIFPEEMDLEHAVQMLRQELQVADDAYVIGYVGRIGTDKRIEFLCEAVRLALAENEQVVFISIGSGPRAEYMQAQLGTHPRVRLLGQFPRDELAVYYCMMDVLVQTSSSEGLSNVLIEALYHGVPVVSTDSGLITRSLISNIVETPQEMADRLVRKDYASDALPENLEKNRNAELWLGLVDYALSRD